MFDKITKRIISFMTAAVMATSNVMPLTSIIAEENEPDLTYQSMELYPNGEEAEQIVTLDGMMPEGAEAEVIDVSADHEGIAAYDITIKDGRKEYQPDEENPIKVEITDPVITESVTLWHIHDDGDREQVLNFAVEDGKVSFYATGFSVYEIVDKTYNIDISYNKVPVEGDTSFSVMSVDTDAVDPISDFTFSIEPKTSPKLIEKITSVDQLETFDLTKTGFYLSGAQAPNEKNPGTGRFALDSVTEENRSGIVVTDQILDMNNKSVADDATVNKHQLLYKAVETNDAVPFYFESTGTDNQYYIYCFSDDGVTKNYIKTKKNGSNYNALTFATGKSDATPYVIEIGSAVNSIKIRTANTIGSIYWYWNYRNGESGTPRFAGTNGSQYADAGNNNIYIWYYALDHELATDPYDLDGKTYGLVNNGYALTTGGNVSNELKNMAVTSGTGSYSSSYAITGWTFKWVEGTDTYKVSAVTENGNTKKYLQLAADGIHLVDESEASALTVTPNYENGKIKLSIPQDNLAMYRDNAVFKKTTDTADPNRYFDLVDVSDASTDVLNLDGTSYALINKNGSNGYALSPAPNGTTKAQTVSARTNDAGKTEYVFIGDVSQWTFHHIDYNRYTISNGTQYLKLVNGSLAVTDEPYILTVVAGSGDNEGKIKICNSTDQRAIKGTFQSDTIANGCWFDLAIVSEAPTEEIYDLDGKTYGLAGINNNKYYAMANTAASATQLSANLLTYNSSAGTFKCADSLITGWTFHWQNKVSYTISTIAEDGSTKFLKADNNGISLVNEADASTFFIMKGDDGKIKICDSETGKTISCGTNQVSSANDSNDANRYFQLLNINNQDDPYKLNGETYGLMYYESGTYGNALMDYTKNNKNNAKLNQLVVRDYEKGDKLSYSTAGITEWSLEPTSIENKYKLKANNGKYLKFNSDNQTISLVDKENATSFEINAQSDGTTLLSAGGKVIIHDGLDFYKTNTVKGEPLYVSKNSDVTEWTFENVSADRYRLKSPDGNYLFMDGDEITVTDTLSDATAFKVIPQDGAVMLSAGGKNVYFDGTNFIADTTGSVLRFVRKKTVSGDEQLTYTATPVSISEPQDGRKIIVYTRLWNYSDKVYEYYAIDYDGSLKRIYPSGNKLIWLDDAFNTLLWELTVYHYDDDRENGYYELKNTYSNQYIAPQKPKDSENILQGDTIGIQLPGRTNGEYYSDIIAWDDDDYEYRAIKGDINEGKIKSTYFTDSDKTWYFAVMEETEEEETDTLHPVETIDNTEHGITMKMIDFATRRNSGSYIGISNFLGSDDGGAVNTTVKLLSTLLGDDGYPTTILKNSTIANNVDYEEGRSLKDLFTNKDNKYSAYSEEVVNHLFIESIYQSSGYFEFDSCQNTATLREENGSDGHNFVVLKELATDNTGGTTHDHGQFYPYDYIEANKFSTSHPQNLYSALNTELPDDDPRKYENMYLLHNPQNSESTNKPNYYNGMEMEASFIQTPSGKDAWGHDVIFEFTGDDDFWFYVDGELVIDLGGIHSALSGKVNFATGEVNVNGVDTTLKKVFYENYLGRNHTAEEAEEYVNGIFEWNGDYTSNIEDEAHKQYVFKDYTNHNMKIFYMERGAGASNLHMRFNLSSVTPGHVLFNKTVKDQSGNNINDPNFDLNTLEFPFKIQWKVSEDEDWNDLTNIDEYDKYIPRVTYQGSTQRVNFANEYVPPSDTSRIYKNVYFLTPGRSLDIDFPDDAVYYRICECAVDPSIFTVNTSDDDNLTDENGNIITQSGSIKDLYTASAIIHDQPNIKFENRMDTENIRSLDITKILYRKATDEELIKKYQNEYDAYIAENHTQEEALAYLKINHDDELVEVTDNDLIKKYQNEYDAYIAENHTQEEALEDLKEKHPDDIPGFSFRLYLSNGTSNEVALTQLRKYYVLDKNNYLCKRENNRFVSIGKRIGDSFSDLDEEQSCTFYTSMNGSISNIPAGYTVHVPGLVVNTKFYVEERPLDNPVGYDLMRFECVKGRKDNDQHSVPEWSYSIDHSCKIKGQSESVSVVEDGRAGTIIAKHHAKMLVKNRKGYGIKADKLWSDADFAPYHDDIHTAIYIRETADNEQLKALYPDEYRGYLADHTAEEAIALLQENHEVLLPDSVKLIKSPNTSVLYFFDDLQPGKTIDDYIVYEVEVDAANQVTNKLAALTSGNKTLPSSGEFNAGESESENSPAEYNVSYPELSDIERIMSENARYRQIKNKRTGGIELNLYQWDYGTENSSTGEKEYITDVPFPSNTGGGSFKLTHYVATTDTVQLTNGEQLTEEDKKPYIDPETSKEIIRFVKIETSDLIKIIQTKKLANGMYQPIGYSGTLPDSGIVMEKESSHTLISDADGNITTIYGFKDGDVYTVEEKDSPKGFKSMPEIISFKVTKQDDVFTISGFDNPNDVDNDQSVDDGKNWTEYTLKNNIPDNIDELIAKINIYNRGFTLKAMKVDSVTEESISDNGTRFALYKSHETAFGYIKDRDPMIGYDDLSTDENGVIEKINNSLNAGTYFLKETVAPSGYTAMEEDIGFTITPEGIVKMVNESQNDYLTELDDTFEIIIKIPNVRKSTDYYFDIEKIIFVDKNIHDSDPEQKFVFKVEQFVEGTTDFTGAPLQVFYVTMNCKDSLTGGYPYANVLPTDGKYTYASADKEVTVTYKTDVSYTFPATILKGRQTVHVQQDGIYRISEVTEWSGTDYDFWTGSNVYRGYGDGTQDGVAKIADGFKDSKSTGTNVLPTNDANCIYIDVKKLKADWFANETATIDGREATRPKASFTNTETEYAYLSSQAYAENTIKRSST